VLYKSAHHCGSRDGASCIECTNISVFWVGFWGAIRSRSIGEEGEIVEFGMCPKGPKKNIYIYINVLYHYFDQYHFFNRLESQFIKYDDSDSERKNFIYLLLDVSRS
jgi:hypothetical protein